MTKICKCEPDKYPYLSETELYQTEITKIKTVLWSAQHICKNAKTNPDLDTNAELQAAIEKIVDAETLLTQLHHDIRVIQT